MTSVMLPAPLKRKWSDRFVLDLAMTLEGSGDTLDVLLESYSLTQEDLDGFALDPLFNQRLDKLRESLREQGLTFRLKAQTQAELVLDTAWRIIHDEEVSAAVRADLIKWVTKMANYEPTNKGETDGKGVTITINMGDPVLPPPKEARVIEYDEV